MAYFRVSGGRTGEDMVPKPPGQMETRQGQSAVGVRRRAEDERRRDGGGGGARPVEMFQRRRRRRPGENRRAHTGARQPVRGEEPASAAGKVRVRFRAPPRRRLQGQEPTAVRVHHVVTRSRPPLSDGGPVPFRRATDRRQVIDEKIGRHTPDGATAFPRRPSSSFFAVPIRLFRLFIPATVTSTGVDARAVCVCRVSGS